MRACSPPPPWTGPSLPSAPGRIFTPGGHSSSKIGKLATYSTALIVSYNSKHTGKKNGGTQGQIHPVHVKSYTRTSSPSPLRGFPSNRKAGRTPPESPVVPAGEYAAVSRAFHNCPTTRNQSPAQWDGGDSFGKRKYGIRIFLLSHKTEGHVFCLWANAYFLIFAFFENWEMTRASLLGIGSFRYATMCGCLRR